jgi:hypothetical protein
MMRSYCSDVQTVGTQMEWVVARSGTKTVKEDDNGLVHRERSSVDCSKFKPLTTMDLFHVSWQLPSDAMPSCELISAVRLSQET